MIDYKPFHCPMCGFVCFDGTIRCDCKRPEDPKKQEPFLVTKQADAPIYEPEPVYMRRRGRPRKV